VPHAGDSFSMEILSSPGTWLLIGALVVVILINFFYDGKPKNNKRSTKAPAPGPKPQAKPYNSRYKKKSYRSPNADNSDRYFSNWQLAAGRKLTGNRCEHTDTRTKKRCGNPWQEGDHFYDYAKGGATSDRNLVGACHWHNDPANSTLKKRNPELERIAIEKRRLSYYPKDYDTRVGEWRDTGLRITFSIGERVCQFEETDLNLLVSDAKEALSLFADTPEEKAKIAAIASPGLLVDHIFNDKIRYALESLEGVDPETGLWVPLRKQSNWALENLKSE